MSGHIMFVQTCQIMSNCCTLLQALHLADYNMLESLCMYAHSLSVIILHSYVCMVYSGRSCSIQN